MPQMVMARNYILRTTLGHTIGFKKGEPVFVHPVAVELAMAAGAEFSVAKDKEQHIKEEAEAPTPISIDEREKRMMDAFRAMVLENNRDDFNGAGYPNVKPLRERVGFAVDAAERTVMWEKFRTLEEA